MKSISLRNVPDSMKADLEKIQREEQKQFYGHLSIESVTIQMIKTGIDIWKEKQEKKGLKS